MTGEFFDWPQKGALSKPVHAKPRDRADQREDKETQRLFPRIGEGKFGISNTNFHEWNEWNEWLRMATNGYENEYLSIAVFKVAYHSVNVTASLA